MAAVGRSAAKSTSKATLQGDDESGEQLPIPRIIFPADEAVPLDEELDGKERARVERYLQERYNIAVRVDENAIVKHAGQTLGSMAHLINENGVFSPIEDVADYEYPKDRGYFEYGKDKGKSTAYIVSDSTAVPAVVSPTALAAEPRRPKPFRELMLEPEAHTIGGQMFCRRCCLVGHFRKDCKHLSRPDTPYVPSAVPNKKFFGKSICDKCGRLHEADISCHDSRQWTPKPTTPRCNDAGPTGGNASPIGKRPREEDIDKQHVPAKKFLNYLLGNGQASDQ
ncbi:hypothetical protein HK102_004606 [Quaeritorhiza haematococci]|nr:hypothetical protein HK102_004606 [Quaeritorhiza haematococci]